MATDINALLEVMRVLRDPRNGCPWDREQDFRTLVPHTLEEAYEVAEAIELGDFDELRLELGDLLFQVVFYAQIASERKLFAFDDVVQGVTEKLIRRHPHVFDTADFDTADIADRGELNRAWEAHKSRERRQKGHRTGSAMDGITNTVPALSRAIKLQKRAAGCGFDWSDLQPVIDKVDEELQELSQAVREDAGGDELAEELGDLLFSCVNVARHLKFDPEQILRQANRKFEQRFRSLEQLASEQGLDLQSSDSEQLEALWEQVKQDETPR